MRGLVAIVAIVGVGVASAALGVWLSQPAASRSPSDLATSKRGPHGAFDPRVSERAELQTELAQLRRLAEARFDPQEQCAAATELERLRGELEALEREVERLRGSMATRLAHVDDSASRVDEGVSPQKLSDPPSAETSAEALGSHLDEVLRADGADPDAGALAHELRASVLDALPFGASLIELRCGASFCRAEIAYPDWSAYHGFVEEHLGGTSGSLWQGPTLSTIVTQPDDRGRGLVAVEYLGRGAYALDRASPADR